jgi:pyruvate dehydrogenase E1 component
VIAVSSPDLLLGILAAKNDYEHLRNGLGLNNQLHLQAQQPVDSGAELVSLAGRRVPVVSVHDGESGLLDNIGSVLGVRQEALAVRKFSKCGRPDQVYGYQQIDTTAIMGAVAKVLSETAMEEVVVSRKSLEELASREGSPVGEWEELWDSPQPDAP